jgi:plastocyanin
VLRLLKRAAPVAIVLAFMSVNGALAAPITVSMTNFVFTPKAAKVAVGTQVTWSNDTTTTSHTSTGDTPLSLWDSGTVPPGGTFAFVFTAGGAYRYHCTFHQSLGMTGSVSVTIKASPPSGPVGTVFTVTVASVNAPAGFVYDIQRKDPGGNFMNWMLNDVSKSVTWDSTGFATGTYSFRSRLHNTSTNATSGYSAAKSVMVT